MTGNFWPWFAGSLLAVLLSVDFVCDLTGGETLSQVIRAAPYAQQTYITFVLALYIHFFIKG